MIRHIHLHYYEGMALCSNKTVDFKYRHIRECSSCSFCHWLERVKKSLTGVRSIYITLAFYRDVSISLPQISMKATWVAELIALKESSHASIAIEMKMSFRGALSRIDRDEYLKGLRFFESDLRKKLESSRGTGDTVIDIPET